jgi:hypothetical protein
MMYMSSIKMQTTVKKSVLLETLKKNLAVHETIVKEAFAGYAKAAKHLLADKLAKFEKGEYPSLACRLERPDDCSEVYKTSIHMLELNNDDLIVLSPDEFRQLVEDKWDWTNSFFAKNSTYSLTASRMSNNSDEDSW